MKPGPRFLRTRTWARHSGPAVFLRWGRAVMALGVPPRGLWSIGGFALVVVTKGGCFQLSISLPS